MKRQRQQALVDLVRREPLSSQEAIRARLSRLGHQATQSTISRDLEELGLVRIRNGNGGYRYVVTGEDEVHPRVPAETLMAEFALRVDGSGNLLVIRTMPGTANAVAAGLDRVELDGVLGTIAGDDTILVVLAEGVSARRMLRTLRQMGGLS